MDKIQKRTFITLLVIGAVYFVIFAFPNIKGSADHNMLAVFAPDEFAQYPHVIRMLTPGKTLAETAFNIIVYRHFYYGYPFYLISAITLLPLRLFHTVQDTPLVMLTLRQIISVLPMIAAILIFVYLQTRFRLFWTSLVLFLLLLSVPAVVHNDMWWHPDSLTILFIALTFFFLDRDDLSFGKFFWLAAMATGLAVGTKLIGLFFFITIPTYIAWGFFTKRINLRRALVVAGLFVLIMVVTVVATNPLLLVPEGRARIFATQQRAAGCHVLRLVSGLHQRSCRLVPDYYGVLRSMVFHRAGFHRCHSRGNQVIPAATLRADPHLVGALRAVCLVRDCHQAFAFSPADHLAVILLPGISSCLLMACKLAGACWRAGCPGEPWRSLPSSSSATFRSACSQYTEELFREETSESLKFYAELERQNLSCLPAAEHPVIYRDVRAYVPVSDRWQVEMKWGLVDYEYIQELNPDVVVLQQQRIKDYTLAENIEECRRCSPDGSHLPVLQ